jgi:hypothetical protein
MSTAKYYLLAFTLMLLIYAVIGAVAWRFASPAAEAIKRRTEQIEQWNLLTENQ